MFIISKGYAQDTFKVECYTFIREANIYAFLFSIDNKTEDELVLSLQGRISGSEEDELRWAADIARLTNTNAVIGDDGKLKASPVNTRKDITNAQYRESTG